MDNKTLDFKKANKIVTDVYERAMATARRDNEDPPCTHFRHAWRQATYYAYLKTKENNTITYKEWLKSYNRYYGT